MLGIYSALAALLAVSHALEFPRPACQWVDPYSQIPWLAEPTEWTEEQFECAMQDLELPVEAAWRKMAGGMGITTPVASMIQVQHSDVDGYGVFARVGIPEDEVLFRSDVQIITRNCSVTADGQAPISLVGMGTVHVTANSHADFADSIPDGA